MIDQCISNTIRIESGSPLLDDSLESEELIGAHDADKGQFDETYDFYLFDFLIFSQKHSLISFLLDPVVLFELIQTILKDDNIFERLLEILHFQQVLRNLNVMLTNAALMLDRRVVVDVLLHFETAWV